jgi:hypothetical protein
MLGTAMIVRSPKQVRIPLSFVISIFCTNLHKAICSSELITRNSFDRELGTALDEERR